MPNYPVLRDRKIKYKSPSGYVHIGKYVPPFEKNATGFGLKGIMVEDFESGKVQCYICGEWYENLPNHLRKHKVSGNDYKDKFGLLRSTALKSKRLRLRQSEIMIKLRKKNKQNRYCFEKNNVFAGNRKDKPKASESKNKYGVCDLQIIDKVNKLAKDLGKTPTLIDLKEEYGGAIIWHLHKRYGSYIKFCKDNGHEPCFSSNNPKYSREYFIEKALSNEPLIRIMTINEQKGFYRHFKGIKELKKIVMEIKENET